MILFRRFQGEHHCQSILINLSVIGSFWKSVSVGYCQAYFRFLISRNVVPFLYINALTLFRMVFFRAAHRWGGGGFFGPPLLKIRHTYPTMMKLGTVIPYLRKIQKMYKSCDTPLGFCWHKHFFTGNHQILLHPEIHI